VLQDTPYQAAWGRALEVAAPLLQDKLVLDVGCGLGTLAMAAARVGFAGSSSSSSSTENVCVAVTCVLISF